jgi:outer membrane protein W
MKKFLLAIIISALSMVAGAQSRFSIGPSAGYGWTSISNLNNSKFKAAGNFGLSSVYSASEHFGIGVDAKYSIEGAKTKTGNFEQEWDLHYVRIPVKAIYFFNNYGSRVRPKIYAGPSLGFLSSSKFMQTGQSEQDMKGATESFDIGATGGVGLNYRLVNKTWFNADLGYYHGFKEINKQGDYSNRNLMLNVGGLFGL